MRLHVQHEAVGAWSNLVNQHLYVLCGEPELHGGIDTGKSGRNESIMPVTKEINDSASVLSQS